MDYLGMDEEESNWSYTVQAPNGKTRTLYLDGRIIFDSIKSEKAKERIMIWKHETAKQLSINNAVEKAMTGIVFEVRQGYKSKDSKRQNADIANASNAYSNGYMPCLMVMSSQIDDDIVARYQQSRWTILQGYTDRNPHESTFSFFKDIIGFDFVGFMDSNKDYFRTEIQTVLYSMMKAE